MIRFENVLKRSLQDILKTSSKRLEGVLKTSWRRLEDVSKTLLQDVLKTSWRHMTKTIILVLIKTSSRRLHQDECLLGIFSPETWFLCLLWHLYLFSWGSNFLLWKDISINRAHKYVSTSVLMHIEKTTRKHFSCLSRL